MSGLELEIALFQPISLQAIQTFTNENQHIVATLSDAEVVDYNELDWWAGLTFKSSELTSAYQSPDRDEYWLEVKSTGSELWRTRQLVCLLGRPIVQIIELRVSSKSNAHQSFITKVAQLILKIFSGLVILGAELVLNDSIEKQILRSGCDWHSWYLPQIDGRVFNFFYQMSAEVDVRFDFTYCSAVDSNVFGNWIKFSNCSFFDLRVMLG